MKSMCDLQAETLKVYSEGRTEFDYKCLPLTLYRPVLLSGNNHV